MLGLTSMALAQSDTLVIGSGAEAIGLILGWRLMYLLSRESM